MTSSPKLEILGRISELARHVEDDTDPDEALSEALALLARARTLGSPKQQVRLALELLTAVAVNWLAATSPVVTPSARPLDQAPAATS